MDSSSQPVTRPFTYLRIPVDDAQPIEELRFTGHSDAELRETLTRHFRQSLLSEDQRTDMARHLTAKADEAAAKQKAQATAMTGEAPSPVDEKAQQGAMIQDYLNNTSYEIVPVTMPMRATGYIGTSLYVDDSGAFKDLPANGRASKLAQRAIRGDAFLLANHDDPALDEWGRVDCTMARYEDLLRHPPSVAYDATNQAQMTQAALLRDSESKRIPEEDVAKAMTSKNDGNQLFAAGDVKAAVEAYSMTVDLTDGRRDLLPNEAEVTALRVTALLNRCLCYSRLCHYNEAVRDARTALSLDPSSVKAHYRLTSALVGQQEYAQARVACEAFESAGGAAEDVMALQASIAEGEAKYKEKQKKMFGKMFQ